MSSLSGPSDKLFNQCDTCQIYFFSTFMQYFSALITARLMSSDLISGGFSSVPDTRGNGRSDVQEPLFKATGGVREQQSRRLFADIFERVRDSAGHVDEIACLHVVLLAAEPCSEFPFEDEKGFVFPGVRMGYRACAGRNQVFEHQVGPASICGFDFDRDQHTHCPNLSSIASGDHLGRGKSGLFLCDDIMAA